MIILTNKHLIINSKMNNKSIIFLLTTFLLKYYLRCSHHPNALLYFKFYFL